MQSETKLENEDPQATEAAVEAIEEGKEEDVCACTLPVKEWLEQEDPTRPDGICRPCVLPFLVQWYGEELTERNLPEVAAKFQGLEEQVDLEPENVAELCDQVKEEVDEDTAKRLREFDCHIQVNAESFGKEEDHGKD